MAIKACQPTRMLITSAGGRHRNNALRWHPSVGWLAGITKLLLLPANKALANQRSTSLTRQETVMNHSQPGSGSERSLKVGTKVSFAELLELVWLWLISAFLTSKVFQSSHSARKQT